MTRAAWEREIRLNYGTVMAERVIGAAQPGARVRLECEDDEGPLVWVVVSSLFSIPIEQWESRQRAIEWCEQMCLEVV